MSTLNYRIESLHPIVGPLLSPCVNAASALYNRSMAVLLAAKSQTKPYGQEIRVVHVPTGEVIYRKTAPAMNLCLDD